MKPNDLETPEKREKRYATGISPEYDEIVEHAQIEARRLNQYFITPELLFLGMFQYKECIGSQLIYRFLEGSDRPPTWLILLIENLIPKENRVNTTGGPVFSDSTKIFTERLIDISDKYNLSKTISLAMIFLFTRENRGIGRILSELSLNEDILENLILTESWQHVLSGEIKISDLEFQMPPWQSRKTEEPKPIPPPRPFYRDRVKKKSSPKPPAKAENVRKVKPSPPTAKLHSDKWSLKDELGYSLYATSIVEFLFHKETTPPLTVGIFAPWGQGKTMLMHLIEDHVAKRRSHMEQEQAGDKKGIFKDLAEWIDRVVKRILRTKRKQASDKRGTFKNLLEWIDQATTPSTMKLEYPTIWFNAWKYQSGEQIWAGLAYTIISQLVDRLPNQLEKEKFWFHLQLRRIDTTKLRRDIHASIVERLLPWLTIFFAIGAIGLIVFGFGFANSSSIHIYGGLGVTSASILISLVQLLLSRRKFLKKTVEGKFERYVSQPNYESKMGYFLEVEEDLKKVFDLLVNPKKPAVIFVDDLDRCSPNKVAEVIEAINLILNGDFKNCHFVIGMDAQVVAGSLDVAYEKIAQKLPQVSSASGSMGWYFLEKFIQLPFSIPHMDEGQRKEFINHLFITDETPVNTDVESALQELNEKLENPDFDVNAFTEEKNKLEAVRLARPEEFQSVSQKAITQAAKQFSDQDKEIQEQIAYNIQFLRNTPRAIKRYANLFRFYRFSQWARGLQGGTSSKSNELGAWLVLMQRWPHLVRFIQWETGINEFLGKSPINKTAELDETIASSRLFVNWQSKIKDTGLDRIEGIKDSVLFDFLKKNRKKGISLQKAVEYGIW